MLLVDFMLGSPILAHTLSAVPEMRVTHERWDVTLACELTVLIWVADNDLPRFDTVLADEPTVTDKTMLGEVDGHRLYRLRSIDEGREVSVYPV